VALNAETIKAGYLKLPDSQKFAITLVVVLLLGGAYFWFLYKPMMEEKKALNVKLGKMRSELNQSKAVAADFPKFEEEMKKLNEKLTDALKQLPGSDEIPKLLKDMESIGVESGVEFLSLKLLKDIRKGFYAEVPVELKLSGGYHDTAVFFDKLSKLPRIINVSNLSLGSPKSIEGKIMLSIGCRATTYKFLSK